MMEKFQVVCIYWVWPPHRIPVVKERFSSGFPTKNVIDLVVYRDSLLKM